MKNQKKDQPGGGGANEQASSSNSLNSKRSSAAQLRITKGKSCSKAISFYTFNVNLIWKTKQTNKDMNELTLPKTCQLDFPDKDDLLNFKLIICPDEV